MIYKMRVKVKIKSKTKKKILLLLLTGVVIGLSRSQSKTRYLLRKLPKAMRDINRDYLWRSVKEFHRERLVEYRENADGSISVVLSKEGERIAYTASLETLQIPTPARWDKRWRLVLFDIPEKKRLGRDALRQKLVELGFKEWQHSVFVYPYPCEKEIDFVAEVFDLRPYVRYAEVLYLTNEASLKLDFQLY